jgi:hypothetical protein
MRPSCGPSRLALLAALVLLGTIPATAVGKEGGTPPQVRTFRDYLIPLYRAAKHGDLGTGPTFRRYIDDRGRNIKSAELSRTEYRAAKRWAPLAIDPGVRKAAVAVALQRIQDISKATRKRVASGNPDDAAYDVALIGAGVHTPSMANFLADADGDLAMVTIEKQHNVASLFAGLGNAVPRNSANRAQDKDLIANKRGFGNKNRLGGPWQNPFYLGTENPPLGEIANSATINALASGSDFLMGSAVSSIRTRSETGRRQPRELEIKTADGTTTYADVSVVGIGFGDPGIPNVDPASKKLALEERAKLDFSKPEKMPQIVGYTESIALANASQTGRDPFRATPGQRRPVIGVLGGKDGGRSWLRWHYGQVSEDAYTGDGRFDVAQRGVPGDVVWFVGKNGPADCKDFILKTRSLYLSLAGPLRGRRGTKDPGRAQIVQENAAGWERITSGEDAGRILVKSPAGSKVVDYLVLATGFDPVTPALLGNKLEPVMGQVPGLEGMRVIAKRVPGKPIYVIGPAAGLDVFGKDELFETEENAAAIFNWTPRIKVLTDQVLSSIDRTAPRRKIERQSTFKARAGSAEPRIIEKATPPFRTTRTPLVPLLLKAEVAYVLKQGRYPGLKGFSLTFTQDRDGVLQIGAGDLDQGTLDVIRDRIQGNALLVSELYKSVRETGEVRFEARVTPEGSRAGKIVEPVRIGY